MRVEFRPQSLVKNIVTENLSKDGNVLNRIVEIPAHNSNAGKVLDITYKKNEFVPTQWYVANYNLFQRNKKAIAKTFDFTPISQNESHTVVKKYGANGYGTNKTIDIANGIIKTTESPIRP